MVREKAEDDHEQKVLDDIEKYGWHCVSILAEGEDGPYAFTVGLQKIYAHPELIIFGLRSETAHQILNLAVETIQQGQPLDLHAPTDALLHNYECLFVPVPASEFHEHVGFCRWYYEGDNFSLYQIVWPTREGNFPWHPDASESFRSNQPVLGHATQ